MKTRAVIPIGHYGLPADMPAIRAIAEKFELHLIEDAAQPLDEKYSGKMSGSAVDRCLQLSQDQDTDNW